jgi:hypothetical protein
MAVLTEQAGISSGMVDATRETLIKSGWWQASDNSEEIRPSSRYSQAPEKMVNAVSTPRYIY